MQSIAPWKARLERGNKSSYSFTENCRRYDNSAAFFNVVTYNPRHFLLAMIINMQVSKVANALWGKEGQRARLAYLLLASAFLLLTALGSREIWTQEHRWADIVSGMFYRHDFLHPYLGANRYYDKPLLSYWLMAMIAQLSGGLSMWALRLPSALAGMLAIFSIYRLGTRVRNQSVGLLSGWLLLTTFYFLFWARTSSADMLNLAGSLCAIAWYAEKREGATWRDTCIFFVILALTSLCKGLGGAVIPLLAVAVDVCLRQSWKQYCRLSIMLSALPAVVLYALPFLASTYIGGDSYGQNGLYLVYRENILRYIHPFDHQGPWYTYFIYLPVYMLPWAMFLVPALYSLVSRWKSLHSDSKWIAWTLFLLFLFFTLSGSRRSYYILPVIPFGMLLIADWILSDVRTTGKKIVWTTWTVIVSFAVFAAVIDVLPAWYYSQYGINQFALALKKDAANIQPFTERNIVLLDGDSKLIYYLQLPPQTRHVGIQGKRSEQTTQTLLHTWPLLLDKPLHTIFITRQRYLPLLKDHFDGYHVVEMPARAIPFLKQRRDDAPIAFVPN